MLTADQLNNLLNDAALVMKLSSEEFEELIQELEKDFANMRGYSQNNPHHCYDLLTHTLQTVIGLAKFCDDANALPLLRVAALFHDIGKPCVAQEKNGRSVFYGHAAKSAEIAEPLLAQIGYSRSEIDRILFYVAHHDDFISFKLCDEMPDKPNPYIKEINKKNVEHQIKGTIRKCKELGIYVPNKNDYLSLLDLCCADASSQSELVIIDGVCIDSGRQKIKRIKAIKDIIEDLSVKKEAFI